MKKKILLGLMVIVITLLPFFNPNIPLVRVYGTAGKIRAIGPSIYGNKGLRADLVDCAGASHYRGVAYYGLPFVVLEESNGICTDAENLPSYTKTYLLGIVLNAVVVLLIGFKVVSKRGKERVRS